MMKSPSLVLLLSAGALIVVGFTETVNGAGTPKAHETAKKEHPEEHHKGGALEKGANHEKAKGTDAKGHDGTAPGGAPVHAKSPNEHGNPQNVGEHSANKGNVAKKHKDVKSALAKKAILEAKHAAVLEKEPLNKAKAGQLSAKIKKLERKIAAGQKSQEPPKKAAQDAQSPQPRVASRISPIQLETDPEYLTSDDGPQHSSESGFGEFGSAGDMDSVEFESEEFAPVQQQQEVAVN